MLRTLLVPLDGSAFAEQALEIAAAIAEKAGASLRLVRVCPGGDEGSELYADRDPSVAAQLHEYLAALAQRVESRLAHPVTYRVIKGPIAESIRNHAVQVGADLIVLATHARGPVARLWLGSVADQLIHSISVPLLLVRPGEADHPVPDFSRIIIPLDGSPLAESVLDPATDLAKAIRASVILVRAIEPVILADRRVGGNAAGGFDAPLLRQLGTEAQEYLNGVARRLEQRGLRTTTCVSVNRPAQAAILEAAALHEGSLVALATHGRSGISRLMLGSVADKVLRGSVGCTLILRPQPLPNTAEADAEGATATSLTAE